MKHAKTPDGKLEVLEVTGYMPESMSPNGGDEYTFKIQKFSYTQKVNQINLLTFSTMSS